MVFVVRNFRTTFSTHGNAGAVGSVVTRTHTHTQPDQSIPPEIDADAFSLLALKMLHTLHNTIDVGRDSGLRSEFGVAEIEDAVDIRL